MTVETDKKIPRVGMRVYIKPSSALFPNKEAVIAYVGTDGISVYLINDDVWDSCIPLTNDEWEPM
jgi:hypothetical protein